MRFDVHPTMMKQKQGAPLNRTHPAKSHRQYRYVQQGVPRRERSVSLFLHDLFVQAAIAFLFCNSPVFETTGATA